MHPPDVRALGDAALVVTFGAGLSEAVNDRVMALAASLASDPLSAHVRDVVPALASLVVHFDPVRGDVAALREGLCGRVERLVNERIASTPVSIHDIAVRYDGPDLADVAAFAGITVDEVVARHSAVVYRVFMLGFLPGFAYLGQIDASIAAPRRAAPRQQVPAGSVGIAGLQTGVYPQDSPGGWQLIGRTSCRMFDTASGRSLLQPGDRVRFVAERSA